MKHIYLGRRLYRALNHGLRRILAAHGVVVKKGRKASPARRRTAATLMDVQDSWSDSAR